jgi:hypothetical protein
MYIIVIKIRSENAVIPLRRCLLNDIYNCASMLEYAAVNKSKSGTFHIKKSSAGMTVIKLGLLFYYFVTRAVTLSTGRLQPTANFPNFLI